MKTIVGGLAIAAVLIGLLWVGQGLGVINWPASSFMIDQRPWVVRGAMLAILGALLLWWTRRRA